MALALAKTLLAREAHYPATIADLYLPERLLHRAADGKVTRSSFAVLKTPSGGSAVPPSVVKYATWP